MQYIVTELLTVKKELTFSLIGAYADKKKAAAAAAGVYKDYNKNASLQNIEMITEWLATRQKYSFRKDKEHRLQLAITALDGETQPEDQRVIFDEQQEQDELMRRVSQVMFEGEHQVRRDAQGNFSCPASSK